MTAGRSSLVPGRAALEAYSFWLLPCEDDLRILREPMAALATLHGHVGFDAHLTVQGDLVLDPAGLLAAAREEAARTPVLSWPGAKLGTSEAYYRALFLQFSESPGFQDLGEAITRRTGTSAGRSPFPHLSLAYGRPQPVPGAAALCAAFGGEDLEHRVYRFDKLAVVLSAKEVPLEQWRVLGAFPLL